MNTYNNNKLPSSLLLIIYSYLLILSIIKESNLIIPHMNIIFNISVGIALIINMFLLISNKSLKETIIPIIILLMFVFFILFMRMQILPMTSLLLLFFFLNSNLINSKSFVICNFVCSIIPFIFIIFLNIVGKVPSITSDLIGVDKGNSLGFIHPNDTGNIAMGIISSLFILQSYINNNKDNKKIYYLVNIFISLVFSFSLYKITNCRELFLFELIVIIGIILSMIPYFNKVIYVLLIPLSVLIPSIIIYFDYSYNSLNNFYIFLDKLFSRRMSMQNMMLYLHPVHLFQYIKNIPATTGIQNNFGMTVTIDNSYLSILEMCGIIGILISAYILLKILFVSIHNRNNIICIVILSVMICSCLETSLFSIFLDGPFIYTGIIFYKYRKVQDLR